MIEPHEKSQITTSSVLYKDRIERLFKLNVKNLKARYIKIKAENYGICPDWHLGAGGKTWIFVDEITIK